MSSAIDITKPVTGSATTQSVRDNFSSAKDEIEAVQAHSGLYDLNAAVASNQLTVDLKTVTGADATTTTGIAFSFRDGTATTGSRTNRNITAALGDTIPQGATLGYTASEDSYIYVYLMDNSGSIEIGFSKKLFDTHVLQSSVAMSTSADSATALYTQTALSNKPILLIGRIKIQTGSTAGDWANAPTEISLLSGRGDPLVADLDQILDSDTAREVLLNNDTARDYVRENDFDKSLYPTIANDATDAAHDIVFGSGRIRSSDGAKILNLSSSLTKQIDATWAAGTAAGGLFSGTVAADTAYACFVIEKDSDGSIDCGFDTSSTAANIPSGYTAYRRIGWVITDSSSNIIAFTQIGDYFRFDTQILDINDTSPGTTQNNLVTSMPPSVIGTFGVYLDHTASVIALVLSSDDVDTAPSADLNTVRVIGAEGSQQVEVQVPTDSSRQIKYRSDTSSIVSLRIRAVSWIDQRI